LFRGVPPRRGKSETQKKDTQMLGKENSKRSENIRERSSQSKNGFARP